MSLRKASIGKRLFHCFCIERTLVGKVEDILKKTVGLPITSKEQCSYHSESLQQHQNIVMHDFLTEESPISQNSILLCLAEKKNSTFLFIL